MPGVVPTFDPSPGGVDGMISVSSRPAGATFETVSQKKSRQSERDCLWSSQEGVSSHSTVGACDHVFRNCHVSLAP